MTGHKATSGTAGATAGTGSITFTQLITAGPSALAATGAMIVTGYASAMPLPVPARVIITPGGPSSVTVTITTPGGQAWTLPAPGAVTLAEPETVRIGT